jgi:hypothetical protein
MKNFLLAIALIAIMVTGVALTGCKKELLTDRGPIVTKEYDITDFTGIKVGHAFELEVTPSDTYKISITASESVLDRVDVSKKGSVLDIDMNAWFFSWHRSPKVVITMPSLQKLELSGASNANIQGFKSSNPLDLLITGASSLDIDMETGDFTAELSGASSFNGYLKTANSDLDLSGASHMKLEGGANDVILKASGASDVKLKDFPVTNADIDFSGASHGELDVSGRLDVELSGASSLDYYGNPTLGKIDISGASDIENKEID